MNKTKRALLSMTVVTTIFCLTIIFNIQLPLLKMMGNSSNSKDVVSTQSDALAKNPQDNTIQSFSYDTEEYTSYSNQYLAAITPTETAIGPDNSLTTKDNASATDENNTIIGTDTIADSSKQTETANTARTDETSKEASTSAEATASKEDIVSTDASTSNKASTNEETVAKEEPKAQYSDIGISVAKDYVNIREDASTDAEVLGKLYRNSAVTIIKEDGDWYYVESGSITGYVKSEFIKKGLSDADLIKNYGTQTACVDVDGLNVREKTSIDSKKLTVIYQNEKYPVVEVDGDWVEIKIEDEGLKGYVKTELVDLMVSFTEAVSKEEEQKILQLKAEQRAKEETAVKYGDGFSYTKQDIALLSCLIHAEAGTQSYEGKLAVANVVLNRVKSSKYADTIKAVIYQASQFSVAHSGSLQKQLDIYGSYSSRSQLLSIKAAKDALEGANNIGSRLYFHSYKSAAKKGYTNKSGSVKLGDHLFW